MTFNLSFNDISPYEPPLQASFSPIPRIQIWSIPVGILKFRIDCTKLMSGHFSFLKSLAMALVL